PLRGLATSDRARQRYRHALVVLEITVTVALLVVAATEVDAARRLLRTNLGFDTAPLLAVTVNRAAGVPIDRILDAIGAVPGVARVAASTAVPMASDPSHVQVSPLSMASDAVTAERAPIGAAYFETLGVPLRS